MAELTFTASDRDASSVTILNGVTETGYRLLSGMSLGDPTFSTEWSGQRSTHGARPAGASAENRNLTLTVRCQGTSKDNLAARESALATVMDRIRRYGGKVSWKSNNQTYRQHALCFTASMAAAAWDNRAESNVRREITCSFVCAPYLEGDACDIVDEFDTDRLTDYTSDGTIAKADLTVTGGLLAVAVAGNPANEWRLIHTDRGYAWNYAQATAQARTPTGTLTNWKLGVVLSRTNATNYVEAYLDDNGTNSRLRIDTVIAGVRANVATKNLAARIIAATPYAIRVSGFVTNQALSNVGISYYSGANDIFRFSTATDSLGGTVATLVAAQYGLSHIALKDVGDTGYGGVTRFAVEPHLNSGVRLYAFDQIHGDAPAKVDVEIAPANVAFNYRWLAFAWQRPVPWNLCLNPSFTTDASGWDTNGVTGICATTTSATVTTGVAFNGDKALRITPNGSDTSGVAYPIYNSIAMAKALRGLTLKARVRSDSSTATVEATFGQGGAAIGTLGSVTLSTQWQEVTATCLPSSSVLPLFAAIRVDGTGVVPFDLDAVSVYATEDGEPAPHTFPTGPVPPFGQLSPAQGGNGGENGNVGAETSASWTSDTSIAAGGETETLFFYVGPHLIDADSYADGEALMEVYVLYGGHADFGAITWKLAGGDAADQFSLEYGSTGLVMPVQAVTGSRVVRVGTLVIPAGVGLGPQAYKVTISAAIAADTNAQPLQWQAVYLMNPRQRVTTPTGKLLADVAVWRPAIASGNAIEIVASDLSRSTAGLLQNGPGPGVGGESLIEIEAGSYQTMLVTAQGIPNEPTNADFGGSTITTDPYRLRVIPRWHWLRDE